MKLLLIMRYLIFTLILSFSFSSQAEEVLTTEITHSLGTSYTLNSNSMNENRRVLVHLPENYQHTTQTYPVIYLLDGDNHFHHAISSAVDLHQHEIAPQMIIVAIPNNENTRRRDLTSNRQNFMTFVKEEVPSFIKENFRTNDTQILFGHSAMGGGLTLFF